jgi:hypothetical protein
MVALSTWDYLDAGRVAVLEPQTSLGIAEF